MDRKTKIVATIGPASSDENTLASLVAAGVDVIRFNFSHGTHREHAECINRIRRTSEKHNRPLSLLQDLQGPKIRSGELKDGVIELREGQLFSLTSRRVLGNENIVSIDYPELVRSVKPGNRILLDDGNLELSVIEIHKDQIETRVVVGGHLKPNKGVNLPGANLDIPALTEKDKNDLAFGLQHEVDAIALSFVRSASDIELIRQTITSLNSDYKDIPIIAKLERSEALDNLEEIIDASDGVMVARGDLGVELSPEAVPIAQKKIIASANRHAKLVITATQMLDSMIHNPRPTRAEATDVANAIFDGTDAVMLSGETAIGQFPVQSVEMMAAIIKQAELHLNEWGHWDGDLKEEASGMVTLGEVTHDDALSITRATRELAHDRNVTAIAVFTQTGRTALLMSKARPQVPILAFTPVTRTYQRLPMLWGVIPIHVSYEDTLEGMLRSLEEAMITTRLVQPGQQVVLISGFPVGAMCPPNLALLHTIRGNN